jgi:photosystem II stability/assembly factor-like uncharacterized protein
LKAAALVAAFFMHKSQYKLLIISILTQWVGLALPAQTLQILASGKPSSLRGLSVPSPNTFWASGTNGTVVHSFDGGKTLHWQTVPGFETRDFRAVEALAPGTVLLMAVASPAIILKTIDTGRSWQQVYALNLPEAFLDDLVFEDAEHGYGVGDPIAGRFLMIETLDGGETWQELALLQRPMANEGEALFASSASNAQWLGDRVHPWAFVTGGSTSRFVKMGAQIVDEHVAQPLPLVQGLPSTGANSWARLLNTWVVVGGNFATPAADSANGCISTNAGRTWKTLPSTLGYKSCVAPAANGFVSCGTSGVATCNASGAHWKLITKQAFHVVLTAAAAPRVAYLAGPNGTLAKITW